MIHAAMRLKPDNAEQVCFRFGRLYLDRRAGAERVAGPAFHLRQVKSDGVSVGGANSWPGGFLVYRGLGMQRPQSHHKCEGYRHEIGKTQATFQRWLSYGPFAF